MPATAQRPCVFEPLCNLCLCRNGRLVALHYLQSVGWALGGLRGGRAWQGGVDAAGQRSSSQMVKTHRTCMQPNRVRSDTPLTAGQRSSSQMVSTSAAVRRERCFPAQRSAQPGSLPPPSCTRPPSAVCVCAGLVLLPGVADADRPGHCLPHDRQLQPQHRTGGHGGHQVGLPLQVERPSTFPALPPQQRGIGWFPFASQRQLFHLRRAHLALPWVASACRRPGPRADQLAPPAPVA